MRLDPEAGSNASKESPPNFVTLNPGRFCRCFGACETLTAPTRIDVRKTANSNRIA